MPVVSVCNQHSDDPTIRAMQCRGSISPFLHFCTTVYPAGCNTHCSPSATNCADNSINVLITVFPQMRWHKSQRIISAVKHVGSHHTISPLSPKKTVLSFFLFLSETANAYCMQMIRYNCLQMANDLLHKSITVVVDDNTVKRIRFLLVLNSLPSNVHKCAY